MYARSLTVALLIAPLAFAQNNTVGQKAIEAHFNQSDIVPDFLTSFAPSALLTINFAGVGALQPGQSLSPEQSAPYPNVTVAAVDPSTNLSGTYTLAMIDADVAGAKLTQGQNRHWLLNGVKVSGGNIDNSSAVAVTSYAGPGPAAGSGPHRYVVMLYAQPSSFSPPQGLEGPNLPVQPMDWSGYAQSLGPLVAANYFIVEVGTSTVSVAATSAVVSSTLSPSGASLSASASGTGSAGGSKPTSGAIGKNLSYALVLAVPALSFIFSL